ncbi:MAG: hypothetical protein R3F59_27595 [Myxococcota bacterium]
MSATRREALQWFTAGAALLLEACKGPRHGEVRPWVRSPRSAPGAVVRYATGREEDGFGFGLLARLVDGRPISVEGLDGHPASLGGTSPRDQASVLSLYDPGRLRRARIDGQAATVAAGRARLVGAPGRDGAGTALLLQPTASPLRLALLARLQARLPALQVYVQRPTGDVAAGPTALCGTPALCVPDCARADRLLLVDADPFGHGPARLAVARRWAEARQRGARTWAVEAAPTLSGARADRRLPVQPSRVGPVLVALARRLSLAGPVAAALPAETPLAPAEAAFVSALADDLRGQRVAVVAGALQPAWVHALAAALSSPEALTFRRDPRLQAPELDALVDAIDRGAVDALLALGGDPVGTAPLGLGLPTASRGCPRSRSRAAGPERPRPTRASCSRWPTIWSAGATPAPGTARWASSSRRSGRCTARRPSTSCSPGSPAARPRGSPPCARCTRWAPTTRRWRTASSPTPRRRHCPRPTRRAWPPVRRRARRALGTARGVAAARVPRRAGRGEQPPGCRSCPTPSPSSRGATPRSCRRARRRRGAWPRVTSCAWRWAGPR